MRYTICVVVHVEHFGLPKRGNDNTNFSVLLNSEPKTICCWNVIIFDISTENTAQASIQF